MAPTLERGIIECRFTISRREALQQRGVGTKLLGSTVKLAPMAKYDSGAFGKGVNRAPNLDLLAAQHLQTADFLAVLAEADDRKMAGRIGGFRTAHVEKAGAVGELDHVIDMSADAHVLVQVLAG